LEKIYYRQFFRKLVGGRKNIWSGFEVSEWRLGNEVEVGT